MADRFSYQVLERTFVAGSLHDKGDIIVAGAGLAGRALKLLGPAEGGTVPIVMVPRTADLQSRAEIERLQAEIANVKSEIEAARAESERLRGALAARDAEIERRTRPASDQPPAGARDEAGPASPAPPPAGKARK